MAVEYRHVRPDEMSELMRAQSLGFGDTTAAEEIERRVSATQILPEWRLCAFDGGAPVAQVVVVPVVMHWNGRTIDACGVTDVFTLPTERRRGLLRELMTRAYAQMREAGQAIAILEASMAAIYQRFGWAVVYTGLIYDFDPRHLRFVDEIATPGRVRLVPREEARAAIAPAYGRYAATRPLSMVRGDKEWAWALRLANTQAPPLLVAVYEEAGDVLGYAIYGAGRHGEERFGPDQRLNVWELVWLTPGAHRALIAFFASHDLVDSVRVWGLTVDDPLLFQAEEPRLLNVRGHDGALARIVDLKRALSERGYAGSGRLRIGVEDGYAPWNSGVWELTVEDGAAGVRRVESEAELRVTPRVLAMLVSGYQPAGVLARAGLIHGAEPGTIATAEALFRTPRLPVCLDHWM